LQEAEQSTIAPTRMMANSQPKNDDAETATTTSTETALKQSQLLQQQCRRRGIVAVLVAAAAVVAAVTAIVFVSSIGTQQQQGRVEVGGGEPTPLTPPSSSTPSKSVPVASSSWQQIGNVITADTVDFYLGSAMVFLTDDDDDDDAKIFENITIIKTAQTVYNRTHDNDIYTGILQVQAYTYHTETLWISPLVLVMRHDLGCCNTFCRPMASFLESLLHLHPPSRQTGRAG
jgi:hypothetical protein